MDKSGDFHVAILLQVLTHVHDANYRRFKIFTVSSENEKPIQISYEAGYKSHLNGTQEYMGSNMAMVLEIEDQFVVDVLEEKIKGPAVQGGEVNKNILYFFKLSFLYVAA